MRKFLEVVAPDICRNVDTIIDDDRKRIPRVNSIPLAYLNLVLQSAFIPDTKIISTFLISNAGLGKSTHLSYLKKFDFVEYVMDMTPKYLADFLEEVSRQKKKFLVLPDFIACLGHNQRTVDLSRSIFRGMMEEGIEKIAIYGMNKDFGHTVNAGLISGITTSKIDENTARWKSDGFYSRLLPFSYSHSLATQDIVMDNFFTNTNPIDYVDMDIIKDCKTPRRSELIDMQIQLLAKGIAEPYVGAVYRPYNLIVALCNSSAVLRHSDKIEDVDVKLVSNLCGFINRKQNPI